MDKTTLISEMYKLYFGSKVFCSDGEEGTLTHVTIDAATGRITHIGVKQGHFFGKMIYVPFTALADASSESVTLTVSRAELTTAPKTQPQGALLDGRSLVQLADSLAKGILLLVAAEPSSGQLAYIVVHGLRAGQDTLLQQEFVTGIETGRVTVTLPEATLQTLPPYRSDAELQREVEDILFDLTPLHVDFKGMSVRVLDGVLYLDGNISSSLRGDMVQDQALGVQGLLEIKNHLVGDDVLAGDLAMALAHDARTRNQPIGVYPRLGVVRLSGAVANAAQRTAAEEIARSFPGVRSVFNDLVIDPQASMLHVMAAAEGGEAEDNVPGQYTRHTK